MQKELSFIRFVLYLPTLNSTYSQVKIRNNKMHQISFYCPAPSHNISDSRRTKTFSLIPDTEGPLVIDSNRVPLIFKWDVLTQSFHFLANLIFYKLKFSNIISFSRNLGN